MQYTAFPASVYDQPSKLLAMLGSWWADDYASKDQVAGIVSARAVAEQQSVIDIDELIASMSRYTVPIYHRKNWHPLYLRESQCNTVTTNIGVYDADDVYDNGRSYDVPVRTTTYNFPKPDDLLDAPMLLNRFTSPSLTLTAGIDYVLSDTGVCFYSNPFTANNIATRMVYENGVVVDREAVLWVFRGEFERDTLFQQFGYAIGMRMPSSPGYRELLNAVYDGITGGMTVQTLNAAMTAMTGIPLVREETETVVDIAETADNLLVITDQHVYKFELAANPIVAVGDTVSRGQALTDAMRIIQPNGGQSVEAVSAITVGRGLLANCFYSELMFQNREVPLVVDVEHPSGYTYVSWELGGFALDVDHFFNEMHRRGVVDAERPIDACQPRRTLIHPSENCTSEDVVRYRGTLAHLLDTRPVAVGEPESVHLPATINPLKFLLNNVLRNNVVIVQLNTACVPPDAIGMQQYALLRKIIPPNMIVLLTVTLTIPGETVTAQNVSETIVPFDSVVVSNQSVTTVTTQPPQVRIVSGTCQ